MIEGEASMKQNIIYVGLDVDDIQYHDQPWTKIPGKLLHSNADQH